MTGELFALLDENEDRISVLRVIAVSSERMNGVLAVIPVLRRVAYLRRLFDWLAESLEASKSSTADGYPELPNLLLVSLERLGDEIASVALLRYCENLRTLNEKLKASKKGSFQQQDAKVLDVQLEHLPNVEDQYEIVRTDCLNTVAAWLVIPALIVLVIALRSCCQ